MRKGVGFLFLALVGLLVALPGRMNAGDCGGYTSSYYGRSSYYSASYPTTYYSAPVYSAPVQQSYTPNPYNIDTLFRVAPELAYGRINDEVATKSAKLAVEQFKAEIQAQEVTRQREADRARQERLLATMEQSLSQQSALLQQLVSGGQPVTGQPLTGDPEKARLAEENRQLRAYLDQLQSPPSNAKPTNPPPNVPPLPQPIPPGKAPPPKGTDPKGGTDPISVIQTAVNSSCLDCHGGQRAGRLNLSSVATLNRGQLSEIQRRLVTPNKKKVMPPPDSGKQSPDIAVYNALDELVDRTPFTVAVGN
jgi:hypothetical protein